MKKNKRVKLRTRREKRNNTSCTNYHDNSAHNTCSSNNIQCGKWWASRQSNQSNRGICKTAKTRRTRYEGSKCKDERLI